MLGLIIMGLIFLAAIGLVIGAVLVEYKKTRETTPITPSEYSQQSSDLQQPGKGLYLSYHERKSWERRLVHNSNGRANLKAASADPLMAEMISNPQDNENKPHRLSYEEWLQLDDCMKDGQTLTECFSQLPLKSDASGEELLEYVRYLEQRYSLKNSGNGSGTSLPPVVMDLAPDADTELPQSAETGPLPLPASNL